MDKGNFDRSLKSNLLIRFSMYDCSYDCFCHLIQQKKKFLITARTMIMQKSDDHKMDVPSCVPLDFKKSFTD